MTVPCKNMDRLQNVHRTLTNNVKGWIAWHREKRCSKYEKFHNSHNAWKKQRHLWQNRTSQTLTEIYPLWTRPNVHCVEINLNFTWCTKSRNLSYEFYSTVQRVSARISCEWRLKNYNIKCDRTGLNNAMTISNFQFYNTAFIFQLPSNAVKTKWRWK